MLSPGHFLRPAFFWGTFRCPCGHMPQNGVFLLSDIIPQNGTQANGGRACGSICALGIGCFLSPVA